MFGKLWRDMDTETKSPYVERELKERDQYKTDMAEWKKQQEAMRIDSPVSHLSSIDTNDTSSWEEGGAAVTRDRDGDAIRVRSYPSHGLSLCQSNCDYNPCTPYTMSCGYRLRYQYMYPQYSPQEQSISRNTQYAYDPENNKYEQHNNYDLNYIATPNADKRSGREPSSQFRHGWPENSSFHQNSNGNNQLHDAKEDIMVHNQQKQPYQYDVKASAGRDMFDVFLEHFDDTKPEHIKKGKMRNNNDMKPDKQYQCTQLNTEKAERKLDQYEYQQQFMDHKFTQQIDNLPQYSEGNASIFNTPNEENYEPLPLR